MNGPNRAPSGCYTFLLQAEDQSRAVSSTMSDRSNLQSNFNISGEEAFLQRARFSLFPYGRYLRSVPVNSRSMF